MAVAVDGNSGATIDTAGVTLLDLTTLTVGVGANRALLVGLCRGPNSISRVTMKWDNAGTRQSLT